MKKTLSFIFIVFILFNSSCKMIEVEPTLADQVSGNYEITTITQGFDSIILPANGYSGEFVVSKLAENQIKLKYAFFVPSESPTCLRETLRALVDAKYFV